MRGEGHATSQRNPAEGGGQRAKKLGGGRQLDSETVRKIGDGGLATFPLSAVHGSHAQPALCLCPDRAV